MNGSSVYSCYATLVAFFRLPCLTDSYRICPLPDMLILSVVLLSASAEWNRGRSFFHSCQEGSHDSSVTSGVPSVAELRDFGHNNPKLGKIYPTDHECRPEVCFLGWMKEGLLWHAWTLTDHPSWPRLTPFPNLCKVQNNLFTQEKKKSKWYNKFTS